MLLLLLMVFMWFNFTKGKLGGKYGRTCIFRVIYLHTTFSPELSFETKICVKIKETLPLLETFLPTKVNCKDHYNK